MQSLINREDKRDQLDQASTSLPSIGCYVSEDSAKAHQIASPKDIASRSRRNLPRKFLITFLAVGLICSGLLLGLNRHLKEGESLYEVVSDFGQSFLSIIQFPVEQIHIVGHVKTSEKEIMFQLGNIWDRSLLAINTYVAQTKIEQLPWVKRAIVERVFPHALNIYVEERNAVGRWVTINGTYVFDPTGFVIAKTRVGEFMNLPMYDGKGAPAAAKELRTIMDGFKEFDSSILRYSRVGDRRWTLHFKNDVEVKLPEEGVELAVSRLKSLQEQHNILNRSLKIIDLRLSDRVTLKPKNNKIIRTITGEDIDGLHSDGGNQIKRDDLEKDALKHKEAEGI